MTIAHKKSVEWVRRGFLILLSLVMVAAIALPASAASAYTMPTFVITKVEKDTSVTIQTDNFPANETFTVRMGAYGTMGIGGTIVGTTNSGAGGRFTETYNIPAGLKGSQAIAIRLDSSTGYYYAYNWFYNDPSAKPATPGNPPPAVVHPVPTFKIVSVVKDDKVTIKTHNLPPDQTFTVRMNYYGTLGIAGAVVATTESGDGGALELEYTIPDFLKGQAQIAIRMDSPDGFYAYNWFWNNTTGGSSQGGGGEPGYVGIPTFHIVSVVRDDKVKIKTDNLPPNQSFTVRMNYYGTLGVAGEVVATTESGSGGSLELEYMIPDFLKGQTQIAIRMDSATGYYYAYNWFWNNTTN